MGTIAKNNKSPRELKGYHVALMMVSFFGVIIAVNVYMAVTASRSWTGLVVKNSYVASAGFNDAVATAKSLENAGWYSEFDYRDGAFTTRILNEAGLTGSIENASITVARPVSEQQDQKLSVVFENGVVVLPLNLPSGLWSFEVNAEIDGVAYKQIARFFVDEQGRGTM